MDVDTLACLAQEVEVGRREGGDTEETRPLGPGLGSSPSEPAALRKASIAATQWLGSVIPSVSRRQSSACQCGVFAMFPLANPVGTIEQTTVVYPRQAVRQLESLARITIRQVAAHGRSCRGRQGSATCLVDPPTQSVGGEGRVPGQRAERVVHDRPGELGRQLDGDVRGDAEFLRQCEHEPAAVGRVRNHNPLRFGRVERVSANLVR